MDMPSISDVKDIDSIRVVLFINNQTVHAPLPALLRALNEQITELQDRVTDLETP